MIRLNCNHSFIASSSSSSSSSTGKAKINLSTTAFNGDVAGLEGYLSTKDVPSSQAFNKFGSSGNFPRYGTLNFSAIPFGPPPDGGKTSAPAIMDSTSGHFSRSKDRTSLVQSDELLAPFSLPLGFSREKVKSETFICRPDIFSTIPNTGTFVFLQKLSSFLTSAIDTSSGVVTTMAPLAPDLLPSLVIIGRASFRYCTMEMCSSLVPGGVSMIK
mmetsp:Transcript_31579/g.66409  ORF Transcript_31579/g.66409 Transcript_31579/m.66409 type:complete len:215 (+) Transcript_31579:759-1403(+)